MKTLQTRMAAAVALTLSVLAGACGGSATDPAGGGGDAPDAVQGTQDVGSDDAAGDAVAVIPDVAVDPEQDTTPDDAGDATADTSDTIGSDADAQGACATEGAACDDGDACTAGDLCHSGTCQGEPLDCSALDGPCVVGACAQGTCVTAADGCTPVSEAAFVQHSGSLNMSTVGGHRLRGRIGTGLPVGRVKSGAGYEFRFGRRLP